MSSLYVRQCLKVLVSSFKSKWLQKKEDNFCLTQPIEKLDSTNRKIAGTKILQIFKSGSSLWKRLGFYSNFSTYKRETLTTFFKLLRTLVCYSLWDLKSFVPFNYTRIYRSKIYNQALVEHSCCIKIITNGDLKPLSEISKSQARGCFCCKSKKRMSRWIRSLHVVVSVSYYMR